jgi:hypothetical protein
MTFKRGITIRIPMAPGYPALAKILQYAQRHKTTATMMTNSAKLPIERNPIDNLL